MTEGDSGDKRKRTRISQTDVPSYPLVEALKVAEAIANDFARQAVKPLRLAQALDMKPSSSRFRTLTGSAVAYGLTTAAYNSPEIGLTELGKKCVAPTYEGQDAVARREAFLRPRIIAEVLGTYNGSKFPTDSIGANVLIDMGIAAERAPAVFSLIKSGSQQLDLTKDIKGEMYVDIDTPVKRPTDVSPAVSVRPEPVSLLPHDPAIPVADPDVAADTPAAGTVPHDAGPDRVYVARGLGQRMAGQIRELLVFGKFQPVFSGSESDSGQSLSRQVIDDMRTCAAAILHVHPDFDNEAPALGQDALMEIGAAMALYGDRIVVLLGRDTQLPGVLDGMREVRYDGDGLDVEATMALLKAFNDIGKTA